MAALEHHLGEVIGVAHGTQIVDHLDHLVLPVELEAIVQRIRLERQADLAAWRGQLQGDMAELRAELKGDISALRAEFKSDLAELRDELKGDMAELRDDIADRAGRTSAQWRRDLLVVTGVQFTALAGAVLALA